MTILIPYNTAGGGPAVFVAALSKHFKSRGHKVIHRLSSSFDILLIIAECPLIFVLYAKLAGKRIVQRLDGVYHIACHHHFYFLKNLRMQIIHNYLADHVIYQSQFAKRSCQTMLGKREKNTSIIYNGVNTKATGLPAGALAKAGPAGVTKAVELVTFANFRRPDQIKPILESTKYLTLPYHLHIYGPHTGNLSRLFNSLTNNPRVTYHGPQKHEKLLADIQRHDIFLFSDQSACPNAVLEALAAGLPVVAFNRGSIPELIEPGLSGEIVSLAPHDPFRDSYPFNQKNYYQFARSIAIVANHLSRYRNCATQRCRNTFDVATTFQQYEEVLRSPR